MSPTYLLGVDIGTYSSKGALVDQTGKVIASHVCEHELSLPQPGWAEHDPEGIWWGEFKVIVNTLLETSRINPKQIAGLGISSISPAVVALDKDGRALRPAILYGIDTRASAEIEELTRLTGANFTSQSAVPKLLWLRRNQPQVWQQARQITNGGGYLNLRLTGQNTIDRYDAASFTPFFDLQHLDWNPALADLIAPLEWMPRPTWTCAIAGVVSAQAARETGLAAGTQVITGTADAAAEAVSAGLAEYGDMMLMYGSSTFFILKTERFTPSPSFWAAPFLESDSYCVAGGTSTAGSLTRWFRDQFAYQETTAQAAGGEEAYTALARLAADSPPGANGLVALPYFYGERTPIHDPGARGMIFGLTLQHTRADIYRALLESVGYSIRHNLDTMRAEGLQPARWLAVGGGTRNLPWMQSISDICGISQTIPGRQAGACYGDAFMAGVGVGMFSGFNEIQHWLGEGTLLHPDEHRAALYDEGYQVYRELYTQNVDLMHRLGALRMV